MLQTWLNVAPSPLSIVSRFESFYGRIYKDSKLRTMSSNCKIAAAIPTQVETCRSIPVVGTPQALGRGSLPALSVAWNLFTALGATELFLKETYSMPLHVIASP
jgi:hypothetical protein